MGDSMLYLRSFPTAQRTELARALAGIPRIVDVMNKSTTIATNTAIATIFTLTAPAAALRVSGNLNLASTFPVPDNPGPYGCEMVLTVAGTLSNNAGSSQSFPLSILLNGTAVLTDDLVYPDAAGTENDPFLLEARFFWLTPTSVKMYGRLTIGDGAVADAGTGSLATAGSVFTFRGASTSEVMERDQQVAFRLGTPNSATCNAVVDYGLLRVG